MFKKKPKDEETTVKTFTFGTALQERDPLTSYPAKPYTFEGLVDSEGRKMDEEWIERQLDLIPSEVLGPTAGAVLDHEIVAAMTRALNGLAEQRCGAGGHVPQIKDTEGREAGMAENIAFAADDLLIKLVEAKQHTAKVFGKRAKEGSRHE